MSLPNISRFKDLEFRCWIIDTPNWQPVIQGWMVGRQFCSSLSNEMPMTLQATPFILRSPIYFILSTLTASLLCRNVIMNPYIYFAQTYHISNQHVVNTQRLQLTSQNFRRMISCAVEFKTPENDKKLVNMYRYIHLVHVLCYCNEAS